MLTIEQNTNPVEIVLHVYKLKEGWDVNNLFTIIPLNAAKSDILALQTIGRGLRLPFGEITHVEEIDTLDIVAHDHYREIIDDIKDNPVFKRRNLDDEDIPETEVAKVEAVVQDQQISIFDDMFKDANVKSFQEIDTNKDIDNLYEAYQKAYVKKAAPKKKDSKPDGQITIFDLFGSGDDTNSVDTGSKEEQAPTDTTVSQDNIDITIELNEPSKSNVPELYVKEIFKQKVEEFKKVAISVPKISISYSSSVEFKPFTVKRNVLDFDVAASKIERYDGGYETIIEDMCCLEKNGKKIHPKYVVSTATIKNAGEQIKCLYARENYAQFPPSGFDTRDSYFIREVPLVSRDLEDLTENDIAELLEKGEKPFRQYVGICASGQSVKTTLIRLYSVLLQEAFILSEDPKYQDYVDPYYTLVGYFNSIRELGGAVRLLDDDINSRLKVLRKKYKNARQRYLGFDGKKEITSRIPSYQIAEILEKLAEPFDPSKERQSCYDVVIATNMIAVGMDVD